MLLKQYIFVIICKKSINFHYPFLLLFKCDIIKIPSFIGTETALFTFVQKQRGLFLFVSIFILHMKNNATEPDILSEWHHRLIHQLKFQDSQRFLLYACYVLSLLHLLYRGSSMIHLPYYNVIATAAIDQ